MRPAISRRGLPGDRWTDCGLVEQGALYQIGHVGSARIVKIFGEDQHARAAGAKMGSETVEILDHFE